MNQSQVFVFSLLNILTVCGALTLSRVVVPSYKYAGETAVLECPYELGRNSRERLYAVKWYFNNEEFYRYVPKYTPPIYTHKIDGIRVQMGGSDSKQVTLQNLEHRSTGTYRCEVSAEAPSFASVHGEGRMTVVHLPEGGPPQIKGKVKEEYEVGDELNFTCSAGKSFPPTKLSWYINDVPVSQENVIDLSPRIPGHSLTPSTSQLRLSLTEEHFTEDGETKIICKANILPISWSEGDERVFGSSRKTELRSTSNTNTNTFNVSPVVLFDEDARIVLRGGGSVIRGESLRIVCLCLVSLIVAQWRR